MFGSYSSSLISATAIVQLYSSIVPAIVDSRRCHHYQPVVTTAIVIIINIIILSTIIIATGILTVIWYVQVCKGSHQHCVRPESAPTQTNKQQSETFDQPIKRLQQPHTFNRLIRQRVNNLVGD